MKYIRTKDGRIIEYKPKPKYENDKATLDWFLANNCGGGFNVSKIADTIEELCDIFVLDNVIPCLIHLSKTKGYYYYYGDSDKKSCLMPIYEEYKIYGAIWTDKGLIYVAKMNEKGDLCLL